MDPYTSLAKKAIENYIKQGKEISPPDNLPKKLLEQKAGVFVTIKKDNKLRGCIGTYMSTEANIAQEIIVNAIAAATKDYRFNPVQEKELPHLSYSVSILSEPEEIQDFKKLDPKKYGIIVKSNKKTGLLLPDLEGIDTIKKQIVNACKKANIDPSKESLLIYKFTVKEYS
jgi:AmmeMemoRadiSam system protein A